MTTATTVARIVYPFTTAAACCCLATALRAGATCKPQCICGASVAGEGDVLTFLDSACLVADALTATPAEDAATDAALQVFFDTPNAPLVSGSDSTSKHVADPVTRATCVQNTDAVLANLFMTAANALFVEGVVYDASHAQARRNYGARRDCTDAVDTRRLLLTHLFGRVDVDIGLCVSQ
jgi:hypothetical protein